MSKTMLAALLVSCAMAAPAYAQALNDGGPKDEAGEVLSAAGSGGPRIYTARISQDGTVQGGIGVTSARTPVDSTGSFAVVFEKNVDQCVYSGVPADFNFVMQTQPRSGNRKAVYVYLENLQGVGTPASFYLTVICKE